MNTKRLIFGAMLLFSLLLLAACQPEASDAVTNPAGGVDLTSASLDTHTIGTSLGTGIIWVLMAIAGGIASWYFIPQANRRLKVPAGLATAFIIMLTSIPLFGYAKIDAGEVGVLLRQGRAIETPLGPGPHTIIPFVDQVVVLSTRPWTYITLGDPTTQGEEEFKDYAVDVITANGVQTLVKYTVQGRLTAENAVQTYIDYGSLENAIEQTVKNPSRVIVRQALQAFTADDLATALDEVQPSVQKEVSTEMSRGGLELLFFGFRKPTLGINGRYEQILDDTAAAIQEKTLQEEQVKVEQQLAQQAIERANGEAGAELARQKAAAEAEAYRIQQEADAMLYQAEQEAAALRVQADANAYQTLTEATATAEANELIAASVDDALIEYLKWVETWDGALPVWITNSSPNTVVPIEQP